MSEPSPPLVSWIEQAIGEHLPKTEQSTALQWQNLSGDAGFRQYFRLNTEPPTLAVVAPPATEKNDEFLAIANYLRERGIRTPKVIAYDGDHGFMLVEDLGSDLLLDHLNGDSADLLYGEALMSLLRLQQLPPDLRIFPPYSQDKLRVELNTFRQWFIEELLGCELTSTEQQLLEAVFLDLEESACEQPQVIVHRDFHSRNLVHANGSGLGVIDFQDAVTGPITYDVVSLLRDCYVHWPIEQVHRWALAYATMVTDVGLLKDVPQTVFLRWFDWMGLQRHLKVLGIFARLSLRDGKHGYLNDLPRVVHYVRAVSRQYPELAPLADWFDARLLPLVRTQPWYKADFEGNI